MGYDTIVENEGRGVVVKWSGVASAEAISSINKEIYSQDRYAKLRYQIWDFTKAVKAKTPQVSPDDARSFAIQDGLSGNKNPGMRIALVGKKEYFAGMDALYEVYADVWAESVMHKVFEGMQEARAWVWDEGSELSQGQNRALE